MSMSAQEEVKRPVSEAPFFVDADVGGMLIIDYVGTHFAHFAVGAGFRPHPNHGLGVEYRY